MKLALATVIAITPCITWAKSLRAGKFPNATTRKDTKVTVIPVRDIERVARQRGIQLPF